MASISCSEIATEVLGQCLAGKPWDTGRVGSLVENHCSDALFGILIEGLADRFEPRLCTVYAEIFSYVLERVLGSPRAVDLLARYERVRQTRRCTANPERVIVLSRVTLGADIAVTSVILDAVKQRFPRAKILLAGSSKAAELFARDPRIGHIPLVYPRAGTLSARLEPWREMLFDDPDAIVVDPDSRLTQLGLLPVCDEDKYFFFESRAFGGDRDASLSLLAGDWARVTFGVDECRPYIAPPFEPIQLMHRAAAINLGVGGNPAKQMPESFEKLLVSTVSEHFSTVIVDEGFGTEERSRTHRAMGRAPVRPWSGSFARFCSVIAQCDAYVGYDSAGQHAAAALGVPLLTLFKGASCHRTFERWKPTGESAIRILRDHWITAEALSPALTSLYRTP